MTSRFHTSLLNTLFAALLTTFLATATAAADSSLATESGLRRPAWLSELPDSVTDILVADTGNATIADIYKSRWQIEWFFKWIKQNLKIKSFISTSKSAVMTQIWIAICVYLILAYIKFQSKLLDKSLQQILRILPLNSFETRDSMALLRGDPMTCYPVNDNRLILL